MSLIICPDCGQEVSTSAVACQNCGRPISDPTIERNVVVAEVMPPVREEFPKWVFIPIALLGVILLFVLFVVMRENDDTANTNLNVNVRTQKQSTNSRDTTSRTEPNQINVPASDAPSTINVPQSQPQTQPQSPSTVTNIPSETTTVTSDKGTVSFEAKVMVKTGGTQAVRNEKFYLLKKDLESILDDADIEDETGQGLKNAFALSVLYPERYRETNQKALAEIRKNSVYSTTTGADGKAQLKDIKPDSYYLFGITKTRTGFAIWSSPVTIVAGQNLLNLSPAQMTEVQP